MGVMTTADVGVLGGSGLGGHPAWSDLDEVMVETPWGAAGPYRVGTLGGRRVAVLARHGAGHRIPPSAVNYRANVFGFRLLGVSRVLSASAVGSLKHELAPRHFVIVDQFIDWTRRRESTFFDEGLVAHVSLADPTCRELGAVAAAAGRLVGAAVHDRGTYVCIEGPQFSTRAESEVYRSWGADVIGMTNATEAKLAREAELCYASVAMVTDYDCWKADEAAVDVGTLLCVLRDNAEQAAGLLLKAIEGLPEERTCACGSALATALVTDPAKVPQEVRSRLEPLVGRYLA